MIRHLILPAVLLLASCGARGPANATGTPVILISVDTLRSDHLPAYGYRNVATPNIDALRADAILYERAYSHCPLTLPSHASVFTGQLPAETGVRDNTGFRLAASSPVLAELLAGQGYATGAAVSAYVLRKGTGIERGFASYDDDVGAERAGATISAVQRGGDVSVASADRWLSANASKPLFYFLHLYEPHSPYEPPAEYQGRYSPYDGEIAHADAIVGRFLQRLKDLGIYEKALIVLFSDHGEGLNDHGEDEHGIFLYREALQVPLLVKLPGAERGGESVAAPVQLSDIYPTVLAVTGTRAPAAKSASNARSLLDVPANRRIYSESYFARFHFGWSDLHSIIDGEHHFIRAPEPELYEVRDLAERTNVLTAKRRVYAAMRKEIEPLVRAAEAPQAIDPEEAAKLAALGYLGSAAPADGPLPDPKTKIDTFRQIRAAFAHFKAGRYEQALAIYQPLLRENPRMLDLWDICARALVRLGRPAEAIAAAKEALKLSPQSIHLAVLIATIAIESGRLDEAEQHAQLALKQEPLQAHEILARVAVARGDLAAAERHARAALDVDARDARALLTLAKVAQEKRDLAAALSHADSALAAAGQKNSAVTGLHLLRGDVLARLGRAQEAEQALRQEIALFPEDPRAYRNLILLYVTEGRNDAATRLIFDLEKASPTPPSYAAISETLRVVGDHRGARFWALRGLRRYPSDQTLRRLVG